MLFAAGECEMRLIADYTLGLVIVLAHLVAISLRGEEPLPRLS
jgi:hypothetical protein